VLLIGLSRWSVKGSFWNDVKHTFQNEPDIKTRILWATMFLEATPIHCETILPDHMSDSESDEEFAEYLPAYYKEAEPVQKKRRYDIRPLEPQTESNIWKPYKPKQQYLKTKAPYPTSKE
jgi:hypothetical protein